MCYTVEEEEEHEKQEGGGGKRHTESQCGGHGERGWVRSLYSNRSVHYDSVCSFPHVCERSRVLACVNWRASLSPPAREHEVLI